MKIREARATIVGTPWRELLFLELSTDEGLTGVSEVRMVNKTETLLACIEELAPRYVLGMVRSMSNASRGTCSAASTAVQARSRNRPLLRSISHAGI